jgi:molybdenum cofactor cytidylyltransferase
VLPADMPFVRPETVARIAHEAATHDRAVVPGYREQRGHPIGVSTRIRQGLLSAAPDRSLKDALIALGERLYLVEVDDPGVIRDVDTRRDLPDFQLPLPD